MTHNFNSELVLAEDKELLLDLLAKHIGEQVEGDYRIPSPTEEVATAEGALN